MNYRARVIDQLLAERLSAAGAVVIEGAKAVGKTATARKAAASEVLLDVDRNAQQALQIDPRLVLSGAAPRLIDEWQVGGDAVWNQIRREVDDRGRSGQFVLTGSDTPADSVSRHTGAGRFSFLRMRPMSLFESGRSSAAVSLADMFDGAEPACPDPGLSLADISEAVAVGGWPAHLDRTTAAAVQANHDYLNQIREVDVGRVGQARRDPQRIERLLRSLARNTATEVNIAALSRDAAADGEPLARSTAYDYLDALERLMITEDQPAWSTHLRSRASLRQAPKRHFVDPSLAVAALGGSPNRLLNDLSAFGCLFESLVVRDLRILAQPIGGTIYHYRDSAGLEVDAIVELPDGRWGAFEVKLGAGQVDAAATNLLDFAQRVDTSRAGRPAVLGVITIASYSYARKDSVVVVPVGALCP